MADGLRRWSTPEPIGQDHDSADFDCGEPSLDEWLRKRALSNLMLGASRTYVVCESGSRRISGYYALSMGQIANADATGPMRRNMPSHIPAVVMGRLAIDRRAQGLGLGAFLLKDAVERAIDAATHVSARLSLVHALSPEAEAFYLHHGFTRLPVKSPMLALDLLKFGTIRRSIVD
ncbi:MAG: GNAT family N-acetyltransferase [Pseudomonadota bacterium]